MPDKLETLTLFRTNNNKQTEMYANKIITLIHYHFQTWTIIQVI